MTGTEKQIEYATKLLNDFTAELMRHQGDECKTTRQYDKNSEAFLATLTDDAHLIIEAFTGSGGYKIDASEIREYGAKAWDEWADAAEKRPTAWKATMAARK